jgi:adenylate kinase family enzyme
MVVFLRIRGKRETQPANQSGSTMECSTHSKQRTVIVGNSGSGKSTLVGSLAALVNVPAIDLDLLHWEGDGHGAKRAEAVARQMVHGIAAQPAWAMEGVYGWLAEVALPRAVGLIRLDLPWSVCPAGRFARGVQCGGTEAEFTELIGWAEAYWERRTPSSFAGHLRLFESCHGAKRRFRDRREIHNFWPGFAPGSWPTRMPS